MAATLVPVTSAATYLLVKDSVPWVGKDTSAGFMFLAPAALFPLGYSGQTGSQLRRIMHCSLEVLAVLGVLVLLLHV